MSGLVNDIPSGASSSAALSSMRLYDHFRRLRQKAEICSEVATAHLAIVPLTQENHGIGRIGALPASFHPPAGACRKRGESGERVLSRVFRMNGLAFGKIIAAPCDDQALVHATREMHLDAGFLRVPDGEMREEFRLEGGSQFAIHASEQVLVEGRGHALGVIVGAQQRLAILDEIDADKKACVIAEKRTALPQKPLRILVGEIADG